MDTVSVALSGLRSAELQLAASAHNVANLNTDGVTPLEVTQEERAEGGSLTRVDQAASPRPVDLISETVDQLRARHQFMASARALQTTLALRGQITNLLA